MALRSFLYLSLSKVNFQKLPKKRKKTFRIMKTLKLLLLSLCTSLFLVATSLSLKAQDYDSCPVTYQEISTSISEAIRADNLFSLSDVSFYPSNSYVTLGKLKGIYLDPRCEDYKSQLKSDLRSFWELVAQKKYFYFRKQAELNNLSCSSFCLSATYKPGCQEDCDAVYQKKLSEISSDESTENAEISDFFGS